MEIGRFTQRHWGVAQRQVYIGRLAARMDYLVDHPKAGIARDDVRPGYRCFHEGRHLIFYRENVDAIDVIRILHERMDVHHRLPPDNF